MNLHIVCTLLTWVMMIPNVFCHTDQNCSCVLGLQGDTQVYIVYVLFGYSSITTILLIICVCCLCCRRTKVKPDGTRHRQQSWHGEDKARDYCQTETISMDQSTESESLSKETSTFHRQISNGSPKLLVSAVSVAVPMPTVPEDYGKSVEPELGQVFEQDPASGAPMLEVQEESEIDIKANSTSYLHAGDEMVEEKQNPEESTYSNAIMIEENECLTSRPKSSDYDIPELEHEERRDSIDSTNYERISFIRRSSSVHDYQYVDNKRTPNASDVVPKSKPAVKLGSIAEETDQKRSDMHYVGLKDDTRSPCGSFYESLETDQDSEGECGTKQEAKTGLYQCLAAIPTGKYTKLSKETQDELSVTMRRQNSNSHAEGSKVPDSNDKYDEKRDSREYTYPPDYLVVVHDESESAYEKPKQEAPMRYVNAEKAPNYMACIKELQQNSSTC